MGLFDQLKLKSVRNEPYVWIKRVVIYEQIDPEPKIIRDIKLTKGINIIWAEEPQDDEEFTNITGHSAGKTSFCRLLRYVLGEKTFANKERTKRFHESLPAGYIAAELCVHGKCWSIIRPLGVGRLSYIKEEVSIDELIAERTHRATLDDYPIKLGLANLLTGLQSPRIVSTGEKIEWGHILAWCTRDQEARFQQIYEWRSPKTDSDWPNVRSPKIDPLFIMRTVLGLLLADELDAEEKLTAFGKCRDALIKEIDDLEKEPIFRVNLSQRQLRNAPKQVYPNDANIDSLPIQNPSDLLDLDRMTQYVLENLSYEAKTLTSRIAEIESKINELSGRIISKQRDIETLEALFGGTQAEGNEITEGPEIRDRRRNQLTINADKKCPFGDVVIGECEYVKKRQTVLRYQEASDRKILEQAEIAQASAMEMYARQLAAQQQEVVSMRSQQEEMSQDKKQLLSRLRKIDEQIHDLSRNHRDLMEWQANLNQADGYPELSKKRGELSTIDAEILAAKASLSNLIKQHETNLKRISTVFSKAIKAVLPGGGYDGEVTFEDRELSFLIKHGSAMNGEAIDTLTVLLCDVTSLIYNLVSSSCCLPGFWIHDSPREADLGLRIYYGFIRLISTLQDDFGSADVCPFQYILTTTTAPPQELQSADFVKLKLDAGDPKGLLFCRDISIPFKLNQGYIIEEGKEYSNDSEIKNS